MTKEEFEQQLQAIIPQPSPETTAALYEMGVDALDEKGPQDVLNAFDFIARNFDREVLQRAYEIIQHGSAALPGELVAAAVFLQNSDTPEHMSQLAHDGHLMCFHCPKGIGEDSPLALCIIIESGETQNLFSMQFGGFEPTVTFYNAKEYARQQGITVTEALRRTSVDGTVSADLFEAQKILIDRWPEMTQALADIFNRCPAVAARIIFNVDQNSVTVEHSPLWQESAKSQETKSVLREFTPEGTERYLAKSQQRKRAQKREER